MANSKVICVRRLLVQMKASNATFRQTLSCKIGEFLPGTAATLLGTRCLSVKFSTSAYRPQDVSIDDVNSSPTKTLFHPRRTLMYVPASDERKTKKVATLKVDTVAFDLEDGVALSQKEKARQMVQHAIANCRVKDRPSAHCEHIVRVNDIESGLLPLDLEAVFRSHDPTSWSYDLSHEPRGAFPDALLLPKVESVEHLEQLDLALAFHRDSDVPPLPLLLLIETPLGLLNLRDMCMFGAERASRFHLSALVFGSDDYLARLGGVRTSDAREVLFARHSLVTHAKAFGLDAIDLVETDFKNMESLKRYAEEGAMMGYTGKQVIHPDQVPIVTKIFSPSPEQVEWAEGLIEAFHHHHQSGKGAFVYKNKMIDRPLLLQAMNVVNLQEAIQSIDSPSS